jgi:hypothetical protein
VISRTGPLLGIIPDESRDIDTSELMPPVGAFEALMRLGALTGSATTSPVTGFAIDHRKVAPGTVFGAFRGARFNGEDFIPAAVRRRGGGGVAAAGRGRGRGPHRRRGAAPRIRPARGQILPALPRTVVAVTGTNGKTSNVELCRQLWRMAGHPSASIGTLGVTTSDEQVTTGLTTPDIVTFLSNMAGLERMGITHAAFEASSHGLSQFRTEGLPVQAPPSPISAATISIITRRWRPISRPRCACSRTCSSPARPPWSGRRRQIGRGDRPLLRARPEGDQRRRQRRDA